MTDRLKPPVPGCRFRSRGGEWIYLESVGRRYEIEDFSGILISSRDVSEKHRLLDELNRSRELFKTTFDTSSSLLSTARPETGGDAVDVNDQWLRSIGYTRDEVIGRTANELRIWGGPGDRDRIVEPLERHGRIDNFETHAYTKSGDRLEILVDARYIDVRGERCLSLSATNVTEQKAMEAQLRQSEKTGKGRWGQLTGGVAHDFNEHSRHHLR
ncbi:MAG: PAS domain-containing protein [Gammaproteobacteria bacterium]|nr:PAS domain-containing protein [Gammaproteobacteria bacterium]